MQNYNLQTQQLAGLCFDFNDCMTQDEGLAGWTMSGPSAVSGGGSDGSLVVARTHPFFKDGL